MVIFTKDGRTAYLAFVRNLPSQILLLSPCIFIPQLKTFSWSETPIVAALFGFFVMFIFAASANVLEFIEAASNKEIARKRVYDLRSSGMSGWRLFLMALWRIPIKELASFIAVMLTSYGGFALVISMVFWTYFPKH